MTEETYIWVRRQWDGTPAKYLWEDFRGAHWDQEAGGRGGRQPQLFIFGYVPCDRAIEGEIGHSGSHGACPHQIKVCVVAKDNTKSIMALLTTDVGPRPSGAGSAANRVLEALAGGQLVNRDLWQKARLSKAHGKDVLDRLVSHGEIERVEVTAPNSAGRLQKQVAWKLVEPGN